jgi:hypothetical protein
LTTETQSDCTRAARLDSDHRFDASCTCCSYGVVTWATWLFAVNLLFAPFIFNCNALEQHEVKKDWDAWGKFLWREEKQGDSWLAYFEVRDLNTLAFLVQPAAKFLFARPRQKTRCTRGNLYVRG